MRNVKVFVYVTVSGLIRCELKDVMRICGADYKGSCIVEG